MTAINIPPDERKAKVRPSVIVVVIALILASLEGGVRILENFQDEIQQLPGISGLLSSGLTLDPYEMVSPKGGYHWVLKPNFAATMEELAEEKRKAGKKLSAAALADILGGPQDKSLVEINSDGFKGRDIDKTHSRVRVLVIGDSCTFGVGDQDYPRYMTERFNQNGQSVEVINAGVEGYSFRNIMLEMDRYLALKPEIVTIYLGWNSLYPNDPFKKTITRNFRSLHFLTKLLHFTRRTFFAEDDYAMKMYSRELHPDRDGPDISRLDDYEPPFLWRLEQIIDAFEKSGSRVVIATLPSLFAMDEEPSAHALEIGHLPEYTLNPYVLARLTERYNEALKRLAGQRKLDVIDLANWDRLTQEPRDKFFSDSVHLLSEGMNIVGSYMADQLKDTVKKLETAQ